MSGNLQHNGLYVSQNLTQNYASPLSNVDRYQQNNMFNDPGLVAVYGSLCAENAVLRERMAQDNLKEEAYRQTGDNGNEVYTFGKNGQPILLLNRKVVRADRVFPDKLCRSEAYYVIEFLNVEQPLYMLQSDYQHDSRLVQAVQNDPGVELHMCRSGKTTAVLLRDHIAKVLQDKPAFYHAGWIGAGEGWKFFVFQIFQPIKAKEDFKHGILWRRFKSLA